MSGLNNNTVKEIVDVINEYDEPDNPLTVEEVLNNQQLYLYLHSGATIDFQDGKFTYFVDAIECYNDDCYCDFEDYRE